MINPVQFRDLVVIPACQQLGWLSDDAVNLLMGTAAQESGLVALKQYGNGPALGLFQMEPDTHLDIWQNYIKYHPETRAKVTEHLGYRHGIEALKYDMIYMAMMCRIHYRRVREPLPSGILGYAAYYKKYYNTPMGAGTEGEFSESWGTLIKNGYDIAA